MSRFTGPVNKKSRRLGINILETGQKYYKNKKRTSIILGQTTKRRKIKNNTDYSRQLTAKQKVRFTYGLNDKQLKRVFIKASKDKVNTANALWRLLEARLDNLVYRMGFASTRPAARQLVNHGHILVNDKKVDIPSATVAVGSTIQVNPKMKKNYFILESIENYPQALNYVKVDKSQLSGEFLRLPENNELNMEFDLPLVIEYYNRLV